MSKADKRWTNPEPPLPFDPDSLVEEWTEDQSLATPPLTKQELDRPPTPTACKLDDTQIGNSQRFSLTWIPLILGILVAFMSYVMRFGIDPGILINGAFWTILVAVVAGPIYYSSRKPFHLVAGSVLLVLACGDAVLAIYANSKANETRKYVQNVIDHELNQDGLNDSTSPTTYDREISSTKRQQTPSPDESDILNRTPLGTATIVGGNGNFVVMWGGILLVAIVGFVVELFRNRHVPGLEGGLLFVSVGLIVVAAKIAEQITITFLVGGWHPVLMLLDLAFLGFLFYVATVFFLHKSYAPNLMICMLLVNIARMIVASLIYQQVLASVFVTIFVAAIWIPYFMVSERVKVTFVR